MSHEVQPCRRCGRAPECDSPMGLCTRCLTAHMLEEDDDDPEAGVEGAPGTVEAGKYELGGELARGGMGSILRVKDQSLRRSVAMKVMLPVRDVDLEARHRFTREALVLARLEHPNIVPIHELGRDDQGRPYYTMKLLQGETLQTILGRLAARDAAALREYSLDRLLTVFRKVCDGIAFAHDRGIIHRDLKPDNIMVGHYGEALIMDWGLAKFVTPPGANGLPVSADDDTPDGSDEALPDLPEWDDLAFPMTDANLTLHGSVMGTPRYMSPEQACGLVDQLDHRSDVFSLGAILYAILTLSPPVAGDDLNEVLAKMATATIIPPTEFKEAGPTVSGSASSRPAAQRPGLPHCPGGRAPAALSAVTMKALQRRPEDRYRRVEELARDVEAYQGGFATSVENPGLARQLGLLVKRHRREFSIALAAWIAISALAIWFVVRLKISERRAGLNADEAGRNAQLATEEARRADAARQASLDALGRAHLALAEAAFRDRATRRMVEQLMKIPAKLRDSNWYYLLAEADTSIASDSYTEFMDAVPHPRRPGIFAIVGRNRRVNLLEARTGSRLLEFRVGFVEKQREGFYNLAISPDGSRIAIGRPWKNIAIHDGHDGRRLAEWSAPGSKRLEFSPDGTLLLQQVGQRNRLRLWDVATGRTLWTRPGGDRAVVAFIKGGREVLYWSSERGGIRRLRVKDGSVAAEIPGAWFNASSLAVHPNGREALIGQLDGFVTHLDLERDKVTWNRNLSDGTIERLIYSADGKRFVSALLRVNGEQSIQVWDAQSCDLRRTLPGGAGNITRLALHPKSGELLVAGGMSRIWDVSESKPKWRWPTPTVKAQPSDLRFWGSGDRLLAPYGNQGIVSLELPGLGPTRLTPSRFCQRVSVSPESGTAVFLMGNSIFKAVYGDDAVTPLDLKFKGSNTRLRLDRQGRRLAVISGNSLFVHDLPSGRERFRLEKNGVASYNDLVWADDTRLVGALTVNSLRGSSFSRELLVLLDAATGERALTVTNRLGINCVAVSSDRRSMAEAGEDRMIRLRDAATLALTREFRAHDRTITALAFHPHEPILASGDADGTVKVWNVEFRRRLETFYGAAGEVQSLHFSPSGRRLACLSENEGVRVWDFSAQSGKPDVVVPSGWQKLLDRIDPVDLDGKADGWRIENGMLASPDRENAIVVLPGELPGTDFQLRVDLRPLGRDLLHFTLPIGDRLTGFDLDVNTLEGRFGGVIRSIAKQPSRRVNRKEIGDPSRRELHLEVRLEGDQVRFNSQLDGMPFCEWSGPVSALKLEGDWEATPAGRLALGAHKATWVVYSLDVRQLPTLSPE